MNSSRLELKEVHLTKAFLRRLSMIRQAGTVTASVTEKVERIIDQFIHDHESESGHTPFQPLTKHGELRLKKCRKYDLGGGYRLITFLRNRTLYVAYIGTHDECSRWMDHRRGLSELPMSTGKILNVADCREKKPLIDPGHFFSLQDTTEEILPDIQDRELRIIFKGLVEGRFSQRFEKC